MGKQNSRIAVLRQSLMTEKVFSVTFNKFLDIVENDMTFMRAGKLSANSTMLRLIKESLGAYTRQPVEKIVPHQMMIIENTAENMYHGSGFLDRDIFTFFYFKDLDKGMVAINKFGTSENTIMRITTKPAKDGIKPLDINPN